MWWNFSSHLPYHLSEMNENMLKIQNEFYGNQDFVSRLQHQPKIRHTTNFKGICKSHGATLKTGTF